MKHLLSIESLTAAQIGELIDSAVALKAERGRHASLPLTGQCWAMIFTKSSTRTRVSFEVGVRELGGSVMFLSHHDIQLGRGEPIKDTARVLGRMVHGAIIRTFAQADVEAFADAFRLHLLAFQTVVRATVPGMKERGHGRIINIISTSVKQPLPNLGVSNTIRGAVAQWSKTLASELGPFGITVNNVLPGATSTERLSSIIKNNSLKAGISEEEATRHMLDEIPLRRFASPEEIAYAAAFLAGPSGSYINGINLPVDGGRTACL